MKFGDKSTVSNFYRSSGDNQQLVQAQESMDGVAAIQKHTFMQNFVRREDCNSIEKDGRKDDIEMESDNW